MRHISGSVDACNRVRWHATCDNLHTTGTGDCAWTEITLEINGVCADLFTAPSHLSAQV